jgi:Zn-finger domain-containing protein
VTTSKARPPHDDTARRCDCITCHIHALRTTAPCTDQTLDRVRHGIKAQRIA